MLEMSSCINARMNTLDNVLSLALKGPGVVANGFKGIESALVKYLFIFS
jgi:hypothetical protein